MVAAFAQHRFCGAWDLARSDFWGDPSLRLGFSSMKPGSARDDANVEEQEAKLISLCDGVEVLLPSPVAD
jgi:hypothetical protein